MVVWLGINAIDNSFEVPVRSGTLGLAGSFFNLPVICGLAVFLLAYYLHICCILCNFVLFYGTACKCKAEMKKPRNRYILTISRAKNLVDVTRLELVTFRTSSGCSTS